MKTTTKQPKFNVKLVLVFVPVLVLAMYSLSFAKDGKYNRPSATPCPDHTITQPPVRPQVGVPVVWAEADVFSPQGNSCSVDTRINSDSGIIFTACSVEQQSTSAYHCLVTSDHEVTFTGTGLTPGKLNITVQGTAVGRTGIDVDANGIFFTFFVDVQPAPTQSFHLYLPLVRY